MIQAFRRDQNNDPRKTFRLMGLDPNAQYEITDLDIQTPRTATGEELMKEGLIVEIGAQPGAAVITYRMMSVMARNLGSGRRMGLDSGAGI